MIGENFTDAPTGIQPFEYFIFPVIIELIFAFISFVIMHMLQDAAADYIQHLKSYA